MPDLDLLFIIGLVIASFIGNLSKKKGNSEGAKRKDGDLDGREKPTLKEVLEEVWQNLNNQEKQERSPPPPLSVKPVADPPPSKVPTQKPIDSNYGTSRLQVAGGKKGEESMVAAELPIGSISNEFLKSRSSLKKAFLVKEILDKPVSIRKDST